ncbi:hypothetical protein D9619_006520 [Psilocybe cf. subviscida]|uniref:Uncharacterized protein n=1 Tax=Psilocybe cf. subviscida TaxID=2480587 RepID=A0A8H5EYA6_9AGAR|nr:hypothetical protein D9619_006520 [Psilocybe cf. subviscida]
MPGCGLPVSASVSSATLRLPQDLGYSSISSTVAPSLRSSLYDPPPLAADLPFLGGTLRGGGAPKLDYFTKMSAKSQHTQALY